MEYVTYRNLVEKLHGKQSNENYEGWWREGIAY
jgi:hypothetical protein